MPVTLDRSMRKYYKECLCDNTLAAMANDGLVYLFEYEDIKHLLAQYPSDRDGWYFNASRDRYIAEPFRGYISVNPMFVTNNFQEVID